MPIAEQQAPLFAQAEPLTAARLTAWAPAQWAAAADWQPILAGFWSSPAAQGLAQFLSTRLAAGATVYPPQPLRALALTPLSKVRVVILGQDPYHGPGQAEGLAFSVAPGIKQPPSLRNIFKELARDTLQPAPPPTHGSLVRWAEQGVLLLNTCLTVEEGRPASHSGRGWEALTDGIFKAALDNPGPVVFMFWGAHAQRMAELVRQRGAAAGRHLVLCANHPSPLSALRPPLPFIGCGHFSQANAFLQRHGSPPIVW